MPARVRLFGSIHVEAGGVEIGPREFGGVKPKQIFEMLVLQRGRAVPKDRLAELLWGDSSPRNVSATLETYIWNIRNAFGPSRLGHRLVVTERDAYRVDPDLLDVDVDRFDELLRERRDGRAMRASLEEALELARGEILEDEPWADWVEPVRDRYRRDVLRCRLELADVLLADRDIQEAAALADSAMDEAPLDERAVRLAMLSRYALGRQADALETYRRCRAALDKDLGLEPTAETRALHLAVLQQEPIDALLPRPTNWVPDRIDLRPAAPEQRLERPAMTGLAQAALATACALLHVSGGDAAVMILLDEAGRLSEALRSGEAQIAGVDVLQRLILGGRNAAPQSLETLKIAVEGSR
jgi:DNA-binding SARP family transcriptional activator